MREKRVAVTKAISKQYQSEGIKSKGVVSLKKSKSQVNFLGISG
jgi:hypothetical protein